MLTNLSFKFLSREFIDTRKNEFVTRILSKSMHVSVVVQSFFKLQSRFVTKRRNIWIFCKDQELTTRHECRESNCKSRDFLRSQWSKFIRCPLAIFSITSFDIVRRDRVAKVKVEVGERLQASERGQEGCIIAGVEGARVWISVTYRRY